MNKAILILDEMPQYCAECIFCFDKHHHEGSFCDLLNEPVFPFVRYKSCPLKELPEKQVRDYPEYDRYITGWDDGWDACLDEILGE